MSKALQSGRVDLGLGRAPGADPALRGAASRSEAWAEDSRPS